jgi:hypothetical protein
MPCLLLLLARMVLHQTCLMVPHALLPALLMAAESQLATAALGIKVAQNHTETTT